MHVSLATQCFFFMHSDFPFPLCMFQTLLKVESKLSRKTNLDMIGGLGTSLNPKFKRRSFHVPNLISI